MEVRRPHPRDTGRVTGAGEDFADFVTARWGELHAVATVTTGDGGAGASVTASALAAVGRRWTETVDEGSPTAAAREAVLSAALAAAGRRGVTPPHPGAPPEPGDPAEADDDGTRAALAAVLAAATPTARAALAVDHWWDESPALVATAARTEVGTVEAALAALRRRLAAAHAASLHRDEAELGWAVSVATIDTLEEVAEAAAVGDPLALVEDARTRGARRRRSRTAALAGTLALVVAAVTALGWWGTATSPAGLDRDSPSWATVSRWTARGPLVDDATVRSIAAAARAADPPARLLYAGPVGDTIALVMTGSTATDPALRPGVPDGAPGPAMGEGFDGRTDFLHLWTAPTRLGPGFLGPTTIEGEPTARTSDLVALSVDQDAPAAPAAVLVLARPTVPEVQLTTGLLPQPDGGTVPVVRPLALLDGVATYTPRTDGFTPQVTAKGYRGPPAGAVGAGYPLPPTGTLIELAEAQRDYLSGVTGLHPGTLRVTSVLEAEVPRSVLAPDFVRDYTGPVRVTVVTTLTPDGGRVRTSRLAGESYEDPWTFLERLAAVPLADPHVLLPLPTRARPGFLAVAPDGATAQLLTLDGVLLDSATVDQGLAVLSGSRDQQGSTLRLKVLAPDGHVVYDAVPPGGQELAD
jgi:hypothetical protein